MVYSKESDGYTHQRSVQPMQVMAFQEKNEEDPSQSTYYPYPTRYQVPNFVWPLGHMYRMQAREEEPPRRMTYGRSRDSDEYVSHITRARIRGKTQAILEGLISSKDMQSDTDESSLESASSVQHRRCHVLDLSRENQIEKIACMNARSKADADLWRYYLDCYTRGLFNLLQPDDPPALCANFQFLSALHPPNEAQRMLVSSRHNTLWTHQSASERMGSLLKRCLGEFGVRYGSLSFFDNNYENFKMESGYGGKRINREISIAAHALYSSDVLVIPDAQLDWRFKGNPLVARKPKIRSFAGAPLISAEGEVFAVLSIFEKRPRTFTAQECELLADWSAEIVNELDSFIEPSFKTTPLLERNSVIDGKNANRGINSPLRDFSTGRVESQYLPPPLNPRARRPTATLSSDRNLCSVNKMAGYTEPTPPSSAELTNSLFDPLCPRAYTSGFYSTSSLTTVPLRSPRTSPLDYGNAAELATMPDLNYVTKSMSPLDRDFAESEQEMWTNNEDNLVDKCIRSQRLGAGHPQMLTPIDDSNMQENKASVTDLANDLRQFYTPHHPEPLARKHTEHFQAGPFQPMPSNRAQQHPEPCPFPANEAQEIKADNQNNNQYFENHLAYTSDKAAEQTEVPADQYPRPLEQGPPIVQRNEKLRKFAKLVGIIGTGGYV